MYGAGTVDRVCIMPVSEIPRLRPDTIDPQLASGDLGDAFQRLVFELLLPNRPNLRRFPTAGRDGGIDLLDEERRRRTVFECKYVGVDKPREVAKRWESTKRNLTKHLPERTQSQYGPWWNRKRRVGTYVLYVSSMLPHAAALDTLRADIEATFHELAGYPHLAHLARVTVDVRSWPDVEALLLQRPASLLRWFPSSRPLGLVPLERRRSRETLHAYLDPTVLPYYSREQDLSTHEPNPAGDIVTEPRMLEELESVDGIIVTGAGGHGKTRLVIELGRLAEGRGWRVFRVTGHAREAQIDRLAELFGTSERVLLLIDYIETQRTFIEAVQRLEEVNETVGTNLRYLANCRTSHYRRIAGVTNHLEIKLAPLGAIEWYRDYRHRTVRHILAAGDIAVSARHLEVCRDVPVLAVFLAYLHERDRSSDLEQLLDDRSFGRWIRNRLARSFPNASDEDLALLVAQFPMPEAGIHQSAAEGELLRALHVDGWIVRRGATKEQEPRWHLVHDVFADQILHTYLAELGDLRERFVRRLLSTSASAGTLRSTLISLQRLLDQQEMVGIDWLELIDAAIQASPEPWRSMGDFLLTSSLLSPVDAADLLRRRGFLWEEAVDDPAFQLGIAWQARQILQVDEVDPVLVATVTEWMDRVLSGEPHDYVLTSALRLAPERAADRALEWINRFPTKFETQYVLAAWLRALPHEDVRDAVVAWCAHNADQAELSFVASSWLRASGSVDDIRTSLQTWIIARGESTDALFVYASWLQSGQADNEVFLLAERALRLHTSRVEAGTLFIGWLDAGAPIEPVLGKLSTWLLVHPDAHATPRVYAALIKRSPKRAEAEFPLMRWLDRNHLRSVAAFIYSAWLEASAPIGVIITRLKSWLATHARHPGASRVYQAWLSAGEDPSWIAPYVKAWLIKYESEFGAGYLYTTWLDAGGSIDTIESHIDEWLAKHGRAKAASWVWSSFLRAGSGDSRVLGPTKDWLGRYGTDLAANYVYVGWADSGAPMEAIREEVLGWLAVHGDSEHADHVYRAWLEAGEPYADIAGGVDAWFQAHCCDWKAAWLAKYLVVEAEVPLATLRAILTWCRTFPTDTDSLWRFTQLGRRLYEEELAPDVVTTAETTILAALGARQIPEVARTQITNLLSYLVSSTSTSAGWLGERVDCLLLDWIRHPLSFKHRAIRNAERAAYIRRVASLVLRGYLRGEDDAAGLQRFLEWVRIWLPEHREEALKEEALLAREVDISGVT